MRKELKYSFIQLYCLFFILISQSLIASGRINNYSEVGNPTVVSIVRQTPTDATTNADEVTFRVTFSDDVARVSIDDFVLSGTVAGDGTIASITPISNTVFDIKVTGVTNSEGTIGLDIKGVDGAGSNNIIKLFPIDDANESGTFNQDGGDAAQIGQSFKALNTGILHSLSLHRHSGIHSYSGTATLKIFAGQTVSGAPLATQEINVTSGSGFETYVFSAPASLTAGDTYTWSWEKGTGSGSANYMGTVTNPYADGIAYVSTLSGFVANIDFVFKTIVASDLSEPLGSTAPGTDESYIISNPPVATNLAILGNLVVGEQLTADYDFSDPQSDTESGSTFKWYRADDASGTNKAAIAGATTKTYTLVSADAGKFISFEVTPSDGTNTGDAVESTAQQVNNLITVQSITRQTPTDATINSNTSPVFRVSFSENVKNVSSDDFSVSSTVGGSVSNVSQVDASTYDVTVNNLNHVDGTLSLKLKGIDGTAGTNDIIGITYSNGAVAHQQTAENDYLNQALIGQTFTAASNNFLTAFTLFAKPGNHTFSGSARLRVFLGDASSSSVLNDANAIISEETVNISSSTDASGQTFTISNPSQLTSGSVYSVTLDNFIGSGNRAFYAHTSGSLAGGRAFFTNSNNTSHAAFDFMIDIFEGTQIDGAALFDQAPGTEESYTVEVDNTPPTVTITSSSNPTSGAFTATFTFSEDVSGFTSEDILVSNAAVSNFNTTSAKTYTATITPSADGDVDIDVLANKVTDAAGNNNTAATQLTVVNDETAPAAPIVASISTDAGSSATDNLTNDQTLEINGTAEVNASVEVFIAGNSVGNTTADGSGDWTFDHTGSTLTEATYSITAKATDAAGNESALSGTLNITIDASAPSVSTGTIVGKTYGLTENVDVTYVFSEIVLVDETNGTPSVTIAMGGQQRVAAYHSGSGTNTLVFRYTTVAGDLDGNGVSVSAINTNGGTIQDAAGNDASTSISVSGAADVRVDTSAPYMSITSSSNTVSGAFTATFTFSEDVSGFDLSDISVGNGSASSFNTTSAKIYTVTITPSANGNVTVNVAADKAQDAGGNGNTAASELRVVNDETAPAAPVISSISTDAGSSATDNLTNDQTLEISGTAEANASVEVFIGGSSIGNTTADGSGNWTYDHTGSSLTEATHSITAKATDAAGNESVESAALSVTVDITAPSAPVITGISNDTGVSDSDGLTNDDEIEIHGTAEANSTVEVFIDNNSVGTIDADASGNWTLDRSRSALAENTYSITAKATDLAGNESSASAAFGLEIDITSPVSAPSVGAVGNDNGPSNSDFITNDQTLIIGGNATANSRVEVYIDGTSTGIATTNAQGTWLFNHEGTTLPASTYSITAKELDNAGNYSPVSAAKTLVIELTQPTVTITSNANDPQRGSFTATFTFSEDVSGFDVNDISVTNGTAGSFSTTSASVYTAKITPSADGQVTVGVAANKATDIAGNFNTVAASINVTNDETAPSLVSATKDSDTQITLTFSEVVAPGANGHTSITVYGGNGKFENAVSASDGTVGDNKIVLTFNSLSALLGDFEVLHSGGSTITDLAGNVYPLDGTGVKIDLDQTVPTLVSATKDSETQITLTFSEPVKTLGTHPTDFTVTDANSTNFTVQTITDGTAEDNELVLTVADLSTAQLNLNITYVNNNNVVTDFGGNSLGSDATGLNISLNALPTATNVDFSGTLIVGETLTGAYTYSDADNDTESGTVFKWYRSDDANGTNKTAIAGAITSTYVLTSTDVDKNISFEVTPNDGKNFGVAVESNLQGPVSKISQTITFNALEAKTYGDASFALSATASSNLGVTYTSSNTSVATVSGNTVSIVGAGETTITASQAGDASYAAATNATQLLTVNKAVLTATAEDKSKVYGEANPSFTITYTGFVNGDDKTVITTEPTASTIADASTGVGVYDITLTGGTAGNYSFNLTSGTLTIGKATLTATADDKSKTYGEVNPAFTIAYTGFVNGEDESVITTEPSASTTADATTGAGTYDIDLAGGTADNYSFNLTSGTLTIGKATLTATADDKSKVYGEANPAFTSTYTGFVNGEDKTVITTEPTASTTADATTGVGTYDIDLAGGAADNYSFSLTSGTLTIGKATLTATAEDKSKTYGEANPEFTVTYTGFVNGDDESAITTEPITSTTADAKTGVGTYDISLSGGVSTNYSFTTNNGTLTIGKAVLTATAEDKSKTYGEVNPTFTITYTGFVNGDNATAITTIPTASTTADATAGVGTYDIDLTGGAADNYSFNLTSGTLTVNKATLTVTADDKLKGFSQVNPELTMTYTGFVNGDDVSDIDIEPGISTTADETTPAGTVSITLTGGSDNNYAFSLVNGLMTIVNNSVVTSVAVPANATYAIGDEMRFIVNFSLPVSITGTPTVPLTVGSTTKSATLKTAVSNATKATFSYTIAEGDLDIDGITLGSSISLNGGTIKDSFGTDALLNLNQVASTAAVLVDGVAPIATLTTAVDPLTNTAFGVNISFDEVVTGFALSDIQVTNGMASNLVEVNAGKQWTVEITPGTDGTVTVGLPANVVTDTPGNANKASNILNTVFDSTAPTALSLTRKTANPILTASAGFKAIFSEDVTGVDLTDFEVILTGAATGSLSTISQVNARTYDITVNGISGEGTIGLNLKNDQSILDAANNPLVGIFTGEVYVTNLSPTDITISSSNIAENNQVGAVIGSFTTIDADQSIGHTYSLVTGAGSTDNAQFVIEGTSLKAASVFDFETKTSYSIRVKTDDGRGGAFEKAFTITINNVTEPKLRVTSNIDIPVTALGLTSNFDITIHNEGEAALIVNSVLFPEGFIGAVTGIIVNPGESRTIAFGFKPTEVKVYSGTIEFITNAGKVSVAVSGEGAIITGVDDGEINPEAISIFPNPASRILNIDLSEVGGKKLDIDIANASGTPLFSRKSFTEKTLQLDVSDYTSGIYIIQITDGESVVRKKVMIKR